MPTPRALASLFTIEAKEYQHFTLAERDATTVTLLVFGICIGIALAALLTFYQRNVPGGFVRALLRAEALSPETAKTLAELGYDKSTLIQFELRHGTVIKKTVQTVSDAENGTEPRYYIPEALKYRAETRFESKGNGLIPLILTVTLSFGLALLLIQFIPLVLSMIDAIL